MATLTIATPAHAGTGAGYVQNVARATRALLAALFAVKPEQARNVKARKASEDISVYRLYRMAGSSDSVMPNLAQELAVIAGRDE